MSRPKSLLALFALTTKRTASTNAMAAPVPSAAVEDRLRGALWGLFAGDALAAPTHWYYGGPRQIRQDYGSAGITGYTKPVEKLSGSIMSKSNVNGGGRGAYSSKGGAIVGDVINHGKLKYWAPGKDYHYHCTLAAGENTLEAQLVRVLMKSITATGGEFNEEHFRSAYVAFMTTPGSHNDAYASTCHRMFFANMVHRKLPPVDCPDNDKHNVDTIDGLVLPSITALAMAARDASSQQQMEAAARTVAVTRNSPMLGKVSGIWGDLLVRLVHGSGEDPIPPLNAAASSLGLRDKPNAAHAGAMVSCYLEQSLPSTLDMLAQFAPGAQQDAWPALLANANSGGENVHRGAILGCAMGAAAGDAALPAEMKTGLAAHAELKQEIDAFIASVVHRP